MINNTTFLSKQIALNALDQFLDEFEKEKPGDELTRISRLSDNKINYITPDGNLISNEWFYWSYEFCEGKVLVFKIDEEGERIYNYLRSDGTFVSENWLDRGDNFSDGWGISGIKSFINDKGDIMTFPDAGHVESFHSKRASVWKNDEYYFIDTNGKRIGNKTFYDPNAIDSYFFPLIPNKFIDGFAIVKTEKYGKLRLMDVDGNILPEKEEDSIAPWGYVGCGYYFVGRPNRMRGVKLKDANTGIVLDIYQHSVRNYTYEFIPNTKDAIRHAAVSMSSKRMPDITPGSHEVVKDNGVMLVGNYWFLGPSNLKVTKKGLNYQSHSPFGDFVTKYPPIKAISNQFIFCAHDDQVIIFDSYHNEYYKTCSRNEIEERIRKREEKRTLDKLRQKVQALKEYRKKGNEATLAFNPSEQKKYDSLLKEIEEKSDTKTI
jgi:hypothetical protein